MGAADECEQVSWQQATKSPFGITTQPNARALTIRRSKDRRDHCRGRDQGGGRSRLNHALRRCGHTKKCFGPEF